MAGQAKDRPPLPARLLGFVSRVGGIVLRPGATLDGLLGGGRGGLADLLVLLALQVVAVQLRPLVAAVWFMVGVSYSAGMSSLLNLVAQSVLYPVVGVFLGAVVASFATRGRVGRERNVDLVGIAAVPAVCLDLVLTLLAGLSGWRPGHAVVLGATAAGTVWFVALVVMAIRRVRAASGGAPSGARDRASRAAGAAVMAVVLALLSINVVWVLRHGGELQPVSSGRGAPGFALPRFGGGEERLAAHRGEVVLLDFWASWCGPCLRGLPHLAELQRRHAKQGFLVLSINVEGDPSKVAEVRRSHAAARELTMLVDRDGETAQRYGVQTLPHLVLVGRDGRVSHVTVGAGSAEKLEAAIEQALRQPRAP